MPENKVVLDTSAWMALIEDEAGADTVDGILRKAESGQAAVLSSFVSYMEVYYITLQEKGEAEANARIALMEAIPVLRVESSRTLGLAAGRLKARWKMSLADAWIAALALETDSTLIHKDPEFDGIPEIKKVVRLGRKSRKGSR